MRVEKILRCEPGELRTLTNKGLRFMNARTQTVINASLFTCMILLVSCAGDVANRYYGNDKYPPKDPNDVEILWQRPTRDFFVIADFQSRREKPQAIREKAAQIGADAVTISILGGYYSHMEVWASSDREKKTYTRITGTAIRYK